MGTLIVVVVGQVRHRKHEATSDDTNSQLTILLNGGLQGRIEEAVKQHLGETLK